MTKPNYSDNDPAGWCGNPMRGAAMGRGDCHAEDAHASRKLYLSRVRLDGGGYDKQGTYFGHGEPLYWYADTEGEVDAMIRGYSREAVKAAIVKRYPGARFFR